MALLGPRVSMELERDQTHGGGCGTTQEIAARRGAYERAGQIIKVRGVHA
jgi:hypothetical protein